jgi:hypothetical protein
MPKADFGELEGLWPLESYVHTMPQAGLGEPEGLWPLGS